VRAVIILFAKAPQPGMVKTRLVPPLTFVEAAELHRAFVDDLITRLQTLTEFDVELHTDVSTDAWTRSRVACKCQIPGGLELRMLHALSTALREGYERVAVVGTDAPTVPLDSVEALFRSPADTCLGPTDDGGFWAISACETKPNMFSGVTWSQGDTLTQTIAAIEDAGLSTELGPAWFDVDEPHDLERLLDAHDLPPSTRQWVQRYWPAIVRRIAKP
jgi:uncharacterized protein